MQGRCHALRALIRELGLEVGIPSACVESSEDLLLGFQTILCAVDFSAGARRAAGIAADLSRSTGVRLALMHVIFGVSEPASVESAQAWSHPHDWPVDLLSLGTRLEVRDARDSLREWAHDLCVDADIHIVFGAAAQEIVRLAEELNALIVLGTHGRTGLDHLLFGSVAERVMRASRTPVLVVPSRSGRLRDP